MNREPTAFQLGTSDFLLFDGQGVRTLPDTLRSYRHLGRDVWALFDADSDAAPVPGDAFTASHAFVVMSSSPLSSRWRGWKKQQYAILWVMDIWSEAELRQVLSVRPTVPLFGPLIQTRSEHRCPIMIEQAMQLSQRHGPSPRVILELLAASLDGRRGPAVEADKAVVNGVTDFLTDPATTLRALDRLDFGDDFASAVFFCRPKNSADGEGDRDMARFVIPTAFLLDRLVEGVMAETPTARQELLDALRGVDTMREATEQLVDALGYSRLEAESGQAAPSSCIR